MHICMYYSYSALNIKHSQAFLHILLCITHTQKYPKKINKNNKNKKKTKLKSICNRYEKKKKQ